MVRPERIRFYVDPLSSLSPRAQTREQLVNYVHLGLLAPESRLPTDSSLCWGIERLTRSPGLTIRRWLPTWPMGCHPAF